MTVTLPARMPVELVLKLGAIAEHDGTTVAVVAGPILAERVDELFKKLPKPIREYTLDRITRYRAKQPAASAK